MSAKDQIKQIVDFFKREPYLKDKTNGMADGLMLGASLADEANELSKTVGRDFKALQQEYTENGNGAQSTAELIAARDGELVVNDRLNRDFGKVNIDLAKNETFLEKNVAVIKNLSALTQEELRALAGSFETHLHLNVDVPLVVEGDPLVFKNTTLRTTNGSEIHVNESTLVIKDKTDIQGFDLFSTNKIKSIVAVKKAEESAPADLARITLDNITFKGDGDFGANIFDIYGSEKGMFGLTIRNIYGSNATNIFNFIFEKTGDWVNANVFENVFFSRMKRLINYESRVPTSMPEHKPATHFQGNIFNNVQGNASGIYIEMANDPGLNRYVNCWVYDVEVYNNKPNLNKMGYIRGSNQNYYLNEQPEFPMTATVTTNQFIRLGYFSSRNMPVMENFLRFTMFRPQVGITGVIYLFRDSDGKLFAQINDSSSVALFSFYTAVSTSGDLIVFMKYKGASWQKVQYYERNGFAIDHMGGLKYTQAELSALTLSAEILPTYNQNAQ